MNAPAVPTGKSPATLDALLARCKCGVYLTVNRHRDLYEKVSDYLKDQDSFNGDEPVADPDVIQRMIETDTIIHLQFYPDTPIGSYSIYHHDLQAALEEAMTCFPEKP